MTTSTNQPAERLEPLSGTDVKRATIPSFAPRLITSSARRPPTIAFCRPSAHHNGVPHDG